MILLCVYAQHYPSNLMKPAEFEEKDFEGPLYNQQLLGSQHLATPGQVFEGSFGVAAVLAAMHPEFWRMFGYSAVPRGVNLNNFRWGFVWH